MIGAMELLMILIIIGIIYSKNAVDRTFRKHADESVGESFVSDYQEFYRKDPKRTIKLTVIAILTILFLLASAYWIFFKSNSLRLLGIG